MPASGSRGVLPDLAGDVHQRALDVGHPEEAPLVLECALVRAERRDQPGIEVLVGDVEEQRGRLEDGAAFLLEHRCTAERVQRAVLGRLLGLTGDDREVERDAELLEEPEHARRPRTGLVMKSHRPILDGAGWAYVRVGAVGSGVSPRPTSIRSPGSQRTWPPEWGLELGPPFALSQLLLRRPRR